MTEHKGDAEQLIHEINSGFVSDGVHMYDTEWLVKPCVYNSDGEYGVMAFSVDGTCYQFTSREDITRATHEYDASQLKW